MDCKCVKHKERTEAEQKKLTNRLNRIEGQVRGVKKMLENDAYCIDILTQVSAIQAALTGFSKELLAEHMKTCVVEDIKDGKEDTMEELLNVVYKFMK